MIYSKVQSIQKLFVLLLILFMIIGCSKNITSPVEEASVVIEFPIGKKAIYANGSYIEDEDSLKLYSLTIYSLQFDRVETKNNSIEYIGITERYNPPFLSNSPTPGVIYPEHFNKGRILVSVNDKWVLFQNSEILDVGLIFMKRNSITQDTTETPNWLYVQSPMFPSRINPNTSYSVIRPNDSDNFSEVKRDFEIKNYIDWNDIYGFNSGLYYSTKYDIKNGFNFNSFGIIDKAGIVLSRIIFDDFQIITNNNPEVVDTTTLHIINRRIVDFTNPDNTKKLSWYAEYVKNNGLTFLKD